jgi:hypothetical protein
MHCDRGCVRARCVSARERDDQVERALQLAAAFQQE